MPPGLLESSALHREKPDQETQVQVLALPLTLGVTLSRTSLA